MSKIDWKKPLRTVDWETAQRVTGKAPKVYTFKSGSQRVVWVDDRVYPVDERGRSTARVEYPGRRPCKVGDPMVENVPEEPKDHLHVFLSTGGEWRVDTAGGGQLKTKADAEKYNHNWLRYGKGVVVKVPV